MSTLQVTSIKSISSAAPVFQNTSGTEIGTLCKAYVNFDGTGSITIRENLNVSSITDTATGRYTINFTNAMPNANYAVGSFVGNYQSTTTSQTSVMPDGTRTTSAIAVRVRADNTADKADVNLIFFGD